MDCPQALDLVDAHMDRELGASETSELNAHLAQCTACREAFDEHAALGAAIRKNVSYHRMPAALRARVRASLAGGRSAPPRARFAWPRWLQLGAVVATTAAVTAAITLQFAAPNADDALLAQIVASHARATVTAHQIDVASTDRHTVKPWLSAKLDFSPRVVDLADAGFPLRGGRVDYVDHRPVAVLVYTARQHVIDLYAWPASAARERAYAKNGYNVVSFRDGDLAYWAISDLNAADLRTFTEKFKMDPR